MIPNLYSILGQHRIWWHRKRLVLDEVQRDWLRGNQSLSKQLTQYANGDFKVKVLREYWQRPWQHEAKKLGIAAHKVVKIREVELYCAGQASVFARSVIPLQALNGNGLKLANLGDKPLGHLLFKQAKVDLTQRDIAHITIDQQSYWARRTIYRFNNSDILVSEFFLKIL